MEKILRAFIARRACRPSMAALVLSSALALAPAAVAASHPGPAIRGEGSASAVPDSYIVVLKDNVSLRDRGVATRARALSDTHGGHLRHVFEHALQGFAVAMTRQQARAVAADPDVAYVEQDQLWRPATTQERPPSWGLDRIDQQVRPLIGAYSYDNTASNVTAYVIDTGIRISHLELVGRAHYGFDFYDGDFNANDCDGHGTHVAGTIGGSTYGVAKRVNLVAVRVFGCTGQPLSTTWKVIAGIDWVTANAVRPAVANVSIEMFCPDGPCDRHGDLAAIDAALSRMVGRGIVAVTAAGNHNQDACFQPMARVQEGITVGATTQADARASYSNWGQCVDVYAPGDNILSAEHTADTGPGVVNSGTSMAAPHVSGAVALILGRNGWAGVTPAQVKAEIWRLATKNVVTGLPAGAIHFNNLLYTAPPPVAGAPPIALTRDVDGRLHLLGVNASNDMWHRFQNTPGTDDWSPWQHIGRPIWSLAAEPIANGKLVLLTTLSGQDSPAASGDDIWYVYRSPTPPYPWTGPAQIPGKLTAVAEARDGGGILWMFGVNKEGLPWLRRQLAPNTDNWTPWISDLQRFATGTRIRCLAAEADGDGRLHVVMLDDRDRIWHTWQDPAAPLGWSPAFGVDGLLNTVALARGSDGRLEMFGTDRFWRVWHRAKAPDSANGHRSNWYSWSQFDSLLTSVAADTDADGRMWVVGVNSLGRVFSRHQLSAGSSLWSAWVRMDGILRP